jgi:putative ABC transport system permease protein
VPDEPTPHHRAPAQPRWRRYLRFWRPDVAADVDDELRFHLEERIDDLVATGMDPGAARREALLRLGNIEDLKHTCRTLAAERERSMRHSEWFAALQQDASYALRGMRGNPSFTAAIVLTIALGIGGTTALFSVVNAVLLRRLPYANPERVVVLRERVGRGDGLGSVAIGPFVDWTEQSTSFEATALAQGRTFNLTDGEPARYSGARVTPRYFQVLHMAPALGRYFLPDETDASRVVVLSHSLWQSHFNGDSSIVGREILLSGEKHAVIGVAPAAHSLTASDERLWTIFTFTSQQRANYGSHTYRAFAKLKAGITIPQSEAELDRIAAGIRAREPIMKDRSVAVLSLRDYRVGDYDTQLWVLLGAVTVVLMIACVNVASLLLARATTRRKEIAIRGALGGERGRLVRQLMTESLVVAVIGGALGLLIARLGVGFLVGTGPGAVPRLAEAGLQLDVLVFAAVATLTCGILFGLAPALRATRVDLQTVLRDGARGSRGIVRDRVRGALVVGEIAVTLVLLVAATLFLRSAHRLRQVDIGFEPADVTMLRVALPADRYDSAATIHRAFSSMVEAVRAIPGVETAGAGTRVPMFGTSFEFSLRVQSRPEEGENFWGNLRIITPGYMEALGVTLRRGRNLQASDLVAGAPAVVVVNETFAKHAFGAADPIGQRISGWTAGSEPEWREVVGVIGDVRAAGQDRDVPPEVYAPHAQARQSWWNSHQRNMTIIVKARPGATVAPEMRAAIRRFDPQLPIFDFQPLDRVLSESTATRRFNTTLLSLLGATGLVLAAIGIYGVIAFFVSQRTHEIGVRVALGATTRDIVAIVLREALVLVAAGIVVGGVAAVWATRVLAGMLFAVKTHDPFAFAAGAAVLLLVAFGASLFPARRAARVDLMRALSSG